MPESRADWLTKVLEAIHEFETTPPPRQESQRRVIRRLNRWRPQPSPLRQVTHIWEVEEEEPVEEAQEVIEDETVAEPEGVYVSPEEPVVQAQAPTSAELSRRRRLRRGLKRCVVM